MEDRTTDGLLAGELGERQVIDLVADWIARRMPGALVRFGEGEGRVLVADPADDASLRVAARKVRRQTGLVIEPAAVMELRTEVLRAFDEADVAGIRAKGSFKEEHLMWVHRIEDLYQARAGERQGEHVVTHCLVSSALRDEFPRLLASAACVSAVTCRDLAGPLREQYRVDARIFQVPSQYIMRNIDGAYEAVLHGTPIWPEFYRELRERVSVREPGEVFLVGAGLFGKELCIHIRDRGGIALDMGSVLDRLADKSTRGRKRPLPYDGPAP